jgi:hypothetical protein
MSVYLTTLFFAAIRAVYLYSAACFFLASGRGAWCWDGFSEIVSTLHNIHSAIMMATEGTGFVALMQTIDMEHSTPTALTHICLDRPVIPPSMAVASL